MTQDENEKLFEQLIRDPHNHGNMVDFPPLIGNLSQEGLTEKVVRRTLAFIARNARKLRRK